MSNVTILYIGNDTILELERLKNDLTGAYLNSAAVAVTLLQDGGAPVGGETWPKTLAYVAGSKGVYRATLPATLVLTPNQRVTAQVTANAGVGLQGQWTLDCVARSRAE